MKSALALLCAAGLLIGVGSALFGNPSPLHAQPASLGPNDTEIEQWRDRITSARTRVRDARASLASAEYAYQDWRQRKRPRGKAKSELVGAIQKAEQELAAAEEELPKVVESARRAGLPPGELRELEVDDY